MAKGYPSPCLEFNDLVGCPQKKPREVGWGKSANIGEWGRKGGVVPVTGFEPVTP